MFKICLDYWNFFVPDVYASVTTGLADGSASFAFAGAVPPPGPAAAGRKALYREVLSRLRLLMITRMAKPEEVRGRSDYAPCGVMRRNYVQRLALGCTLHHCAVPVQLLKALRTNQIDDVLL